MQEKLSRFELSGNLIYNLKIGRGFKRGVPNLTND